jgi:hypothetical protein
LAEVIAKGPVSFSRARVAVESGTRTAIESPVPEKVWEKRKRIKERTKKMKRKKKQKGQRN